ncbi:class I SAM-dependent methyltransferase [Candidatus Latescibacterota bacterium]
MDYRTRIYKKYSSLFKQEKSVFNEKEASSCLKSFDYYLRGWLPEVKESVIVDLACGNGKLLYFFKQRGFTNITGVDISPEQVMFARKVVSNVILANINDFLDDYQETFDLITGFDIIEHFNKDEVLNFLDNCYAALKPNGRIILKTLNADSPFGVSIHYGDFTHETGFTPESLAHLLRLCGFDSIDIREMSPVPIGYSVKSTMRYIMWRAIRCLIKFYNLVETGGTGSGVYTRVFIIKAKKINTHNG